MKCVFSVNSVRNSVARLAVTRHTIDGLVCGVLYVQIPDHATDTVYH